MGNEFTMLDVASSEGDIILPKRIRYLPKLFRDNYIYRKLPVKKEEIQILGISGIKLVLPFTRECISGLYGDTIIQILKRIIMRENIRNAVADYCIEPYLDSDVRIDGKAIPYFIAGEILNELVEKKEIDLSEVHFGLIDSGDELTTYILDKIIPLIRYCTVLTERSEEIKSYAESVILEMGIEPEVVSFDQINELPCDIIFDLNANESVYQYYPAGSSVYDFSGNFEKSRKVIVKKKKTMFYNAVDVMTKGIIMDHKILQALICGETFEECRYNMEFYSRNAEQFHLQVKNLKYKVYS